MDERKRSIEHMAGKRICSVLCCIDVVLLFVSLRASSIAMYSHWLRFFSGSIRGKDEGGRSVIGERVRERVESLGEEGTVSAYSVCVLRTAWNYHVPFVHL